MFISRQPLLHPARVWFSRRFVKRIEDAQSLNVTTENPQKVALLFSTSANFVVAPPRILILSILFYVQKMARWDGGPKGVGRLRANSDVSGRMWPRIEMWEPDGVLEQRDCERAGSVFIMRE